MAKEITATLSKKAALFEAEIPGTLKVVVGEPGPPGKTPVKGVDYFTEEDISEIVEEVKQSYSGDIEIKTDDTLKMENGILSVNTVDEVIENDNRPVTSGAVFSELSGGNVEFQVGETLILENGILSVNTTNDMERDNTLPITSAGVFATVGNIEALLKTI